jgi:hypothetical protein
MSCVRCCCCPTLFVHAKNTTNVHNNERNEFNLRNKKDICQQCHAEVDLEERVDKKTGVKTYARGTVAAHVVAYPCFPLNPCCGWLTFKRTCKRCNNHRNAESGLFSCSSTMCAACYYRLSGGEAYNQSYYCCCPSFPCCCLSKVEQVKGRDTAYVNPLALRAVQNEHDRGCCSGSYVNFDDCLCCLMWDRCWCGCWFPCYYNKPVEGLICQPFCCQRSYKSSQPRKEVTIYSAREI